ncbi:AraC family transcriptional regulator [Marinilabiliaceae bacterium JC017]|nr:AraC family transcriptional regulator [Marinilabiliaceae bacterium JC017]
MNAVYIIGIFLAFFISTLLFTKKDKSLPDKILAVWMCIIAIHLLNFYLYTLNYWIKFPHLVGLTSPFPFFHGPMLYLYVLYSLKKEKQLRKVDFLHFLPIVLSYLYMFKFIFFYTAEQKRLVDAGELDVFSTFINLSLIGMAISIIVYPILSFKLLSKYKKMITSNFSYDERINLSWIKNIILSLCSLFLVTLIVLTLQFIVGFEFSFKADNIFYGLAVFLIVIFGFYGVRQQNIFISTPGTDPITESKSGYEKSGLKTNEANNYHKQLLDIMVAEKPYLDSKLTLGKLASMLTISSNHLSQIINQCEKVNFYDFVNRYRIEEFKSQAGKNPHFNILALALESGFNSKSSFNNIFKKQTGQTPTQYLSTH